LRSKPRAQSASVPSLCRWRRSADRSSRALYNEVIGVIVTLNPQSIDALKKKLIPSLENIVIEYGLVKYDTDNPHLQAFLNEANKHFSDHITDIEIRGLLYNMALESIPNSQQIIHPTKFIDLRMPEIIKDVSERLLAFLQSLPRSYEFIISLPTLNSSFHTPIHIGDTISLEIISDIEDFQREFSIGDIDFVFAKNNFRPTTILRIFTKGYASPEKGPKYLRYNSAIVSFFSYLRHFISLSITKGLLKETINQYFLPLFTQVRAVFFDKSSDITQKFYLAIPQDISNFLLSLEYAGGSTIDESYFSKFGNLELLSRLQTFSIEDYDSKDIEAILSALEWLFDGLSASSETTGLINLCIGLEAIVGNNLPEAGIKFGISDRCAYLTGNNEKDRKLIRNNISALYTLRSKLVHGRQRRLEQDEMHHLFLAKGALMKAIRCEYDGINNRK